MHHLAATMLSKIGEADLAWIPAEHAMQAADEADDPLVLAPAARSGTHALLAAGRFDDALELGDVAAKMLPGRPYDLRHAAVSSWIAAGVPLPDIADRAGHTVDMLTKVYAKFVHGTRDVANRRIEDFLDGDLG